MCPRRWAATVEYADRRAVLVNLDRRSGGHLGAAVRRARAFELASARRFMWAWSR